MVQTSTKKKSSVKVAVRGGSSKERVDIPACFSAVVSDALVAQVVHTTSCRARIRRAHTKERGEVRGGGAKPWRQKGTGKARHGSRRSPIWRGGGITFGPRSRVQRVLPVPKKLRVRALSGALAYHVAGETLEVLRFPKDMPTKTKEAVVLVKDMAGLLIVVDEKHKVFARVVRNIPRVRVVLVEQVMVKDIVIAQHVWVDEDALSALESRCTSKQLS